MTLHANTIEFTWLAVSILALLLTVRRLRDTIKDVEFQTSANISGPRRMLAEVGQRAEVFRVVKCLIAAFTAFASLFLEPPPPEYRFLPQSTLGIIAWIVIVSIMAWHSWLDGTTRTDLAKFLADAHPMDPVTKRTIVDKIEEPEQVILDRRSKRRPEQ